MRARRHTAWLLGAVLLVGGLDGIVRLGRAPQTSGVLAPWPGFDPAAADRITLGHLDAPVVLERRDGAWHLVAPITGAADSAAVEALLAILAPGVVPEVQVDDDDDARYGLDGGDELRIDIEGQGRSLLTLHLGHDTSGGSSWVRWAGAPAVYRARIGGRGTYDRSPPAWRARQILDLDPTTVTAIAVSDLVISRGDGGWSSPTLAVDDPTVAAVVAALSTLEGLEIAAPGTDPGQLRVTLTSTDGPPVGLWFEAVGDLWFAGRSGTDDRFRVASDLPSRLASAHDTFADRRLWPALGPIARIARRHPSGRGRVDRIASDPVAWASDRAIDVDVRRAEAASAWLTEPRVSDWIDASPGAYGFPSDHRLIVDAEGGQHKVLEIGVASGAVVAVRDPMKPKAIGWVDQRIIAGIGQLFAD